MHIHNYNKCVTITDIRNFMHSYHGLIQVLLLITGLYSFRTPVGVTELMLITGLCSFMTPVGVTELMLITGLCSFRIHVGVIELMLITGLCSFRTPVGVTELTLVLRSLHLFGGTRRYRRDYRTYTNITELILIRKYL